MRMFCLLWGTLWDCLYEWVCGPTVVVHYDDDRHEEQQ